VKLKDKTAADIVASWSRINAWLPGKQPGVVAALRHAMLALDDPDLPEELIAWQEAVQASQQALFDPVEGQYDTAVWRAAGAARALRRACQKGVTCEAQGQVHG
jgi:hypothetical protein